MQSLRLELGERSYPIYIGPGLLRNEALLQPYLRGHQVLIISNTTVAPLYQGALQQTLSQMPNIECASVILPDGEQYKSQAMLARIYDALIERRFNRDCCLIALGGGVIGDIAGYAAATYQRGVDFIQVPTTLLAQVDSSVGGKTGINHPGGKNMIGAFHQPRCVLADTDTLNTLEAAHLRAGLAEVIKYGLIRDAEFLAWIETSLEALLGRDAAALTECILRSCRNKAEIVAEDERESGVRALLNLGHTFGHAIENATGYGSWLHGEAVAAGTVQAAQLSARCTGLLPSEIERIVGLYRRTGLPIAPPTLPLEQWLSLMSLDKKVSQGKLRFVLLEAIGQAVVRGDVPPQDLEAVLVVSPRGENGLE